MRAALLPLSKVSKHRRKHQPAGCGPDRRNLSLAPISGNSKPAENRVRQEQSKAGFANWLCSSFSAEAPERRPYAKFGAGTRIWPEKQRLALDRAVLHFLLHLSWNHLSHALEYFICMLRRLYSLPSHILNISLSTHYFTSRTR